VDSGYASSYRRLYQEHWWWRSREGAVLDELARLNSSGRWGRILDVGCGDGLFFPKLARLGAVEGVEPNGSIISAYDRPDGHIHLAAFDEGFQPGKLYDLILMLDVLEHLPDPIGALRRAECLLKPEGTLIVTVPAFNLLWTRHDDLNEHIVRFTRSSLKRVLSSGGFVVRRSRYTYYWLFGAKLVVRGLQVVMPGGSRIPKIPPPCVNRTLIALCGLERKLLGGLNPPFGSSLLVVAAPASAAA
jgi:SAM-dependent methyltransferase